MLKAISSYRVEEEIARGGMGVIYRAVHTVFDEVVAIKAIFPELTLNPEFRERFLNEAKIQRRLQHPNIVQIREFLSATSNFFIIMEYIDGETLAERLKHSRGPLPLKDALDIFDKALQGLGYAHSQGVVHRDIKPSNIILSWRGDVKLTDFGIARVVEGGQLTKTGSVLGTPAYMAPEQIQGQKVSKAADIYSMGVTLYEMLTGRPPFVRPKDSDTDFAVLEAHIRQKPPAPTQLNPSLPPYVEAAITKALAKKPDQRFSSCAEFGFALKSPEELAELAAPVDQLAVIEVTRPPSPPTVAPATPPPSPPPETRPKPSTVVAAPSKPRVAGSQQTPAKIAPARAGGKLNYVIAVSVAFCALAALVWYAAWPHATPPEAPVQEPAAPTAEHTPTKKKGSRGAARPLRTEGRRSNSTPAVEPQLNTSPAEASASNTSGENEPLSAEGLKRLAGAGLSDQQIIKLVRRRGIKFTPTPSVLEDLRAGGVPESVLQSLGSPGTHP